MEPSDLEKAIASALDVIWADPEGDGKSKWRADGFEVQMIERYVRKSLLGPFGKAGLDPVAGGAIAVLWSKIFPSRPG